MRFYVSVMLSDFERGLAAALDAGFHPEIRMTDVEYMRALAPERVALMRRRLEERGASVFTHGPFLGLDIASLNDHIARYSAECLERGLEITAALGGSAMVIHSNYSPFFSRAGFREWARNWSARMPAILETAKRLGVRVAVENAWERTPETLAYLLDALPRGEASVCIDTGHLAAFSRLPVGRWWDVVGDRVIALHLHDNDGLSDDHLPPGAGIFDFPALAAILASRKELPLMTLEVDCAAAPAGRRHLEKLFEASEGRRGTKRS